MEVYSELPNPEHDLLRSIIIGCTPFQNHPCLKMSNSGRDNNMKLPIVDDACSPYYPAINPKDLHFTSVQKALFCLFSPALANVARISDFLVLQVDHQTSWLLGLDAISL